MTNSIIGILLAAGQSSRFGSNKLLHTLPDTGLPIAMQAANNLLQAIPNSIAVVRPEDLELKSLLSDTNIQIIENRDANLGMSSSIRCAISADTEQQGERNEDPAGYIIALADMPYIPTEVYQNVAKELLAGAMICAPQYHGERGHPVGFSIELKNELLSLSGDTGAKSIIDKYSDQLKLVASIGKEILKDIDYLNDVT